MQNDWEGRRPQAAASILAAASWRTILLRIARLACWVAIVTALIAMFVAGSSDTSVFPGRTIGAWLTPLVIVGLSLFGLRAERVARKLAFRRNEGLCLKCGYNLRENTSGICPECGNPVASEPAETPN